MGRHIGYKHTEESKRKISLRRLGMKFSAEHRAKLSAAKLGKTPWNKGKEFTEEHRKNLSTSHMGNVHPLKGKSNPKIAGSNNWRWKGGITSVNTQIRHSLAYRQWRTSVFKRDNFTCVQCKQRGMELNADHIEAFAVIMRKNGITSVQTALICTELWDITNGRTLCVDCHKKTDNYGAKSLKNYA